MSVSADQTEVSQNVLNLIHAKEVQAELKFTPDELVKWEKGLREIDRKWWPSRNLPQDKQRTLAADLETKVIAGLKKIRGQEAVDRLRQIEAQSQGARMLARPEVSEYLGLDASQHKQLLDLFHKNDAMAAKLAKSSGDANSQAAQDLNDAKASEPEMAVKLLSADQKARLQSIVGKPFDTSKLDRIYPFAPELADSGYWISSNHPQLASLKGSVVLVHFYAFQCHNCVANFDHYKRWDESLKKKGVHLIGIQTPETPDERDPKKVTAAALEQGFEFPVLIDVENKNWDAWGNTMWPTVYVIDKKGYIRYWWQGELNWEGATGDKRIETLVDQLLAEK